MPKVMVYMQYCFIVLGLATILGVVLLYYRKKVRPLHRMCMDGWMDGRVCLFTNWMWYKWL